MLSKLTIRNTKRSVRDYLIYIVTMSLVATLMFAFNGMIFSKDMREVASDITSLIVFISMAAFFIVIIVIWLVHYMVNFMLEKRSREFGTYLLLGIKKRKIAAMFRRENLILGLVTFVIGIIPGMLFQLAFTNVFYSMMDTTYRISPDFSPWTLLMTFGLYFFAYVLALLRVGHRIRKLTIGGLIYMDKKNEKSGNSRHTWQMVFVLLAVLYIIFFNILVLMQKMTIISVWFYIGGLIAAVYLLYIGLSSLLNYYIQKKRKGIYKDANLFVFRQMSSKMRTMRFTMGTMTVLFTTALLAWMCVTMFVDFQNNELEKRLPFDLLMNKEEPTLDYDKEIALIDDSAKIEKSHAYLIYQNGSDVINEYLYQHVDGAIRPSEDDNGATYYQYDTYMGISDYNYLRKMAGYGEVKLASDSYLIQCKDRVKDFMKKLAKDDKISFGGTSLTYHGTYTEQLAQSGTNGADYLVVVPDETVKTMTPYYSGLAAMLKSEGTQELEDRLFKIQPNYSEEFDDLSFKKIHGFGSDSVFNFSRDIMVKAADIKSFTSVSISLIFFLAYVGIIFLCAALTILAVQQLSDSSKFKFRYQLLGKLGVGRRRMNHIVLKQLGIYYLCPFLISIILTLVIGLYASERFVYFTGVSAGIFTYYISAVLIFAFVYLIYMAATYFSFMRNIE